MPKEVAIILAGGQVEGFGVLTQYRPKAALPVAGFYRLIDFALSNLSHSEISHVGLIIQYQPASLIEHVGNGEFWDLHGVGRLLKLLPPYIGPQTTEWFTGTAHALYQNRNFIQDLAPDDILILSGEHIYKMDYGPLLRYHRERGADVTIATKHLPADCCSRRFGYVRFGASNEITEYYEKPDSPPSQDVSMGLYIFRRQVLMDCLEHNARDGRGPNLAIDVIPFLVGAKRVLAWPFNGTWDYVLDIEDYYQLHQRLLQPHQPISLMKWGVMTNTTDRGLSSRVSARIGGAATVEQAMLSPGVEIEGTVRGTVCSPGVIVEKDAVVEDSILMHDVIVRRGAKLRRVIADKDTVFGEGAMVGMGDAPRSGPGRRPGQVPLTVVGKGTQVEAGVCVPPGKEIAKDYCRDNAGGSPFPEGAIL